ncbi:MAG: LEA type 2 family protein [Wenzhouxiangella sp.]
MRRVIVAVLLVLTGCAGLSPYPDPPTVSVTSFALAPATAGSTPRFRVGLTVVNPNRRELSLVGMSYSIELEGARILNGATADLPLVPAYGSAEFSVDLSPDLLGSVRLLADLTTRQRERLSYRFQGRLDVGGWTPDIRVEQSGEVRLGPR